MNQKAIRITVKVVSAIVQKRNPHFHKGNYGHAVIVAGSFGKMGAAALAASACLRTGYQYCTHCFHPII